MFTLQRPNMIDNELEVGAEYTEEYPLEPEPNFSMPLRNYEQNNYHPVYEDSYNVCGVWEAPEQNPSAVDCPVEMDVYQSYGFNQLPIDNSVMNIPDLNFMGYDNMVSYSVTPHPHHPEISSHTSEQSLEQTYQKPSLEYQKPNMEQNLEYQKPSLEQSLEPNLESYRKTYSEPIPVDTKFNIYGPLHSVPLAKKMDFIPNYPTLNAFDGLPKRRYRVVRGVSAGGCQTRPPKQPTSSNSTFLPVQLKLMGAGVEDICFPKWSHSEKMDKRRIVRIERVQNGAELVATFSIVGAAEENPVPLAAPPNVDVVEVSCLECQVRPSNGSEDDSSSEDESLRPHHIKSEGIEEHYQYYITSVEVVEIVELLIGTELADPAARRRERGRVRSNLVPFWSKKPISTRMNDVPSAGAWNSELRADLARRIMGYEIRKPRGFDKEVRILRWDKLVPALKRALQSYYTEIPK